MGHVAQAFRSALRPDPRLDSDGHISYAMQQCFKGYVNMDPPEKQQKAIPFSVLLTMMKFAGSCALAIAIAQLAMGGFFFAMRSCEYSKAGREEKKRTKILCLRNIRFFKDNKEIPHGPNMTIPLDSCDYVYITYERQKNNSKNDSVGMYRSKTKAKYDSVTVWAAIVTRLWSYEGTSMDTKVNTFQFTNTKGTLTTTEISSYRIRTKLRMAVKMMGKGSLGFDESECGLHSIRSGAAMALFLAGVPVLTIMIIGRWKSDAFLRYIRKQVALFSQNLTDKMLQVNSFFTMPDFHRTDPQDSIPEPSPATLGTENGPSRSWGIFRHEPTAVACN